ncbi:hypothetical protein VNO77_44871 [Canavalia gladiata]|uniref:Uncharacterized protein n=1 Tax=Canavalia gladiata TaxID=3824 RepID=A0AAN9JWM6_CANGL
MHSGGSHVPSYQPLWLKTIALVAHRHIVPTVVLIGNPCVVTQDLKLNVVKWEVAKARLAQEILLIKKHDSPQVCKICQVAFVRFVTYTILLRTRIFPTNEVYGELFLLSPLWKVPVEVWVSLYLFKSCHFKSQHWKDCPDLKACYYGVRKISSSLAKENRRRWKLPCPHAEHMQVRKPQKHEMSYESEGTSGVGGLDLTSLRLIKVYKS